MLSLFLIVAQNSIQNQSITIYNIVAILSVTCIFIILFKQCLDLKFHHEKKYKQKDQFKIKEITLKNNCNSNEASYNVPEVIYQKLVSTIFTIIKNEDQNQDLVEKIRGNQFTPLDSTLSDQNQLSSYRKFFSTPLKGYEDQESNIIVVLHKDKILASYDKISGSNLSHVSLPSHINYLCGFLHSYTFYMIVVENNNYILQRRMVGNLYVSMELYRVNIGESEIEGDGNLLKVFVNDQNNEKPHYLVLYRHRPRKLPIWDISGDIVHKELSN